MADLGVFANALRYPKQTFREQGKHASLSSALAYMAAAGIISGLINAVSRIITGVAAAPFIHIVTAVLSLIIMPVVAVASILIWSGIYFLFSKVLKGTGTYTQQTYLISLYQAPLTIISSLLPFITAILFLFAPRPVSVLLIILGALALTIYSFYVLAAALQVAHGFGFGKALAVAVIPSIVLMAIIALMAGLFIYGLANAGL